jgi:hypothetical protein
MAPDSSRAFLSDVKDWRSSLPARRWWRCHRGSSTCCASERGPRATIAEQLRRDVIAAMVQAQRRSTITCLDALPGCPNFL